jgi:hypothetical protein
MTTGVTSFTRVSWLFLERGVSLSGPVTIEETKIPPQDTRWNIFQGYVPCFRDTHKVRRNPIIL